MKNAEITIKQYLEVLNEKKEKCKQNSETFTKDNRKDEADLEKIKLNIYDIFTTMLSAAQKATFKKEYADENEKHEAFCNEYLKSFDKIPMSWKTKLEKAKENNDTISIVIEETKLSIASELKNTFINLM